jgi:predicted nuclease with TOPRIM domain
VADPERLAPCERCAELQARVNKLSEKLARAGVDKSVFEEMREKLDQYRDSFRFKGKTR